MCAARCDASARPPGSMTPSPTSCATPGVSLLIDGGAGIEEVADLTGDDPGTLYRHYRHKVRPVVTVAAERMGQILGS